MQPNEEGRTPVAVITGHSSGLGWEIAKLLAKSEWIVYGISMHQPPEQIDGITTILADIQWPDEITSAIQEINDPDVDLLINCAGVNHLTPIPELKGADWERLIDINAKAPWLMVQGLLDRMSSNKNPMAGGTVINIVSNAAHVPMTHSLAYNASKGAALMVSKQMARELFKSHGITVFSISPNKLRGTGMSKEIEARVPALRGWTPEEAAAYQKAALPTGMETDPAMLAEFIAFLVSTKERHIYLHGCDIPYGG